MYFKYRNPCSIFHLFGKSLLLSTIILYCLFIVSCKSGEEAHHLVVSADSLSIPSAFVNKKFNLQQRGNKSIFQGYAPSTGEFLLFDLDQKKILFKKKIPVDFKNECTGPMIQFYIHSPDSILIVSESRIFMIDSTGDELYSLSEENFQKKAKDNTIRIFDYGNYFPVYYDPSKSEILARTMCNCYFMDSGYFSKKIEARISLKTDSIVQSGYGFPERYNRFSYGQSVFPFRIVNGDKSILSFESDDSVYVYDRTQDSLKSYYGKSRFQEKDFVGFDTSNKGDLEKYKEHLVINPTYKKILYDPYKKIYYRFFLKEQPLRDENGIFSDVMEKSVILMIMDETFDVIHEENIGTEYLWYYSFVTKKGLYIQKKDRNDNQSSSGKAAAQYTVFNWE